MLDALKEDGARLLEQLINDFNGSAPGQALVPGEQRYGLRSITVLTLLGEVLLRRPYYYNETLSRGRFALDQALGLHNGYSPCVARMMGRAQAIASNIFVGSAPSKRGSLRKLAKQTSAALMTRGICPCAMGSRKVMFSRWRSLAD